MKTSPALAAIFLIGVLFWPTIGRAQLGASTGAAPLADYAVAQVGPNSIIWKNAAGQSVTEIATGMNYWSGNQWATSVAAFVPAPDGSAFVASQLQDPTTLAVNLNVQGAVTVQTPENVTLQSTPIAIGLYDAASGKSIVVATLTNCTGVQADAQDVVYNNALVGSAFSASVVYSLPDCGSFHQDIVFTGFNQDFNPTNWGFLESSTNTLQIQIFTEFYNNPAQPLYVTNVLYEETNQALASTLASPNLTDYTLDFGHYVFGPGYAYSGSIGQGRTARVAKDFITEDGRNFLIESVPLQWIETSLRSLPPVAANVKLPKHPLTSRRTMLASMPRLAPLVKPARNGKISSTNGPVATSKPVAAAVKPKGVTVDYEATVSSTSEATVFAADTTYFVSGGVVLSGQVTMESAVFKFPTNSYYIKFEGSLTLGTTNYRPAIFTAADDNTAGTVLSTNIYSGYTGNPSGKHYGSVAGAIILDTTANFSLNNFRFCYLNSGLGFISVSTSQTLGVSHSQFVNCETALYIEGYSLGSNVNSSLSLTLENCLFCNISTQLDAISISLSGSAYDCTIDSCSALLNNPNNESSGTIGYTNCIFSSTSYGYGGYLNITGSDNAFYSATAFGTPSTSLSSNPYLSVGAGNYYLASTSSLLTLGTTNVGSSLFAQLQMKTTQAPLILTNSFTSNTTLWPVAQRDTVGTALGFHYDPIDFISECDVSNATLLLTNGVVMGYYDDYGVWLEDDAQLISQGAPNYRNYVVYYGLVQEQPVNLWNVSNAIEQVLPIVPLPYNSANKPTIYLRLTSICAPQGETNLLNTADSNQVVSSLGLRDCEIYGAGANWLMTENTNKPYVALTNNVFHRVPVAITNNATLTVFNTLFYGTTNTNTFDILIQARNTNIAVFTLQNNVFDGVKAALQDTGGGAVGYNAYLHGATNINGTTNSTDLWPSLTWMPGALGAYYQTNTSPLLTNGSTYATDLGLYHYTVLTNQTVEGLNIVSRGYHYIALGANGLPLDTSGDGIPDYLADVNGNNSGGSGAWSNYVSPNGLAAPSGLLVFTPLK